MPRGDGAAAVSALPAWSQKLTDEELRAAWARLRKQEWWPATFELAMDDPFFARLVASEAKHPTKPQLQVVRQVPHPWPFMSTAFLPKPPVRPVVFDIKRAAAGDRDD